MNGQDVVMKKNRGKRSVRVTPLVAGFLCAVALSSCTDETSERDPLRQTLARPHNLTIQPTDPLDAGITTASISSIRRSGIFIQIPAGLPNELASHLLARFQEASIAKQLPLTPTGTIPELTIKGVARAGAARNGTAVALVWEVLGPDGKRVKLLNGDALIRRNATTDPNFYDPWAMVDEATLEQIADGAAEELAAWYTNRWLGVPPGSEPGITTASLAQENQPLRNAPIDFTTPSLVQTAPSTPLTTETTPMPGVTARDATLAPAAVPAITISQSEITTHRPAPSQPSARSGRALFDVALGPSPGDGQLSLAAAVQEALIRTNPTADDQNSAYRVIGTVALNPSKAGKAQVKIEWTVFTKEGTALGTINQSNEVEAAAIAGPWGEIAAQAGTAAAAGILELITTPPPRA
ncbi:MAG: hypothetical protein COA62_05725 [Rhodobiaceae bacterium]|nr:MAG: hypothetical protein COA62_05725 [Rhodobiaceae bacterium]